VQHDRVDSRDKAGYDGISEFAFGHRPTVSDPPFPFSAIHAMLTFRNQRLWRIWISFTASATDVPFFTAAPRPQIPLAEHSMNG
jgi:hypothetical protein